MAGPQGEPFSRLSRRRVLQGLAAAGFVATGGLVTLRASAQAPRVVSAVRRSDGGYAVVALDTTGALVWEFPLPHRGHSVTPSPNGQVIAAFPRRPGQTVWLLSARTGELIRSVDAGPNRQMNGHGVFSDDGRRLYVTETVFGAVTSGEVTVYDLDTGSAVRRFASGGLDPHQCVWCGDHLVVAHGGYIEFQDKAQPKVLDPTRPPNLAWLNAGTGAVMRRDQLDDPKLSIRHLAADRNGVFAGFQHDDGPASSAPLLGYATPASPLAAVPAGEVLWSRFKGYVGSVAIAADHDEVVATSPKGGVLGVGGRQDVQLRELREISDVCGAGATDDGWIATTGFGVIAGEATAVQRADYAFDNHLAVI